MRIALSPFTALTNWATAKSRSRNGSLRLAKTVWEVAENCRRHFGEAHFHLPRVVIG